MFISPSLIRHTPPWQNIFQCQKFASSSSSASPISDILVNIGSSTLLKLLYYPFQIIILDFVSSKKTR